MRVIKIPSPFNKYQNEWYFNFIKTYNSSSYYLKYDEIKSLVDISENSNIKIILYTIYQILITDDLSPSSLNPKPSNGIELKNPYNLKPFGIYHIHLNHGYVLLWYLEWGNSGYSIKFFYEKHPPANDDYRTIIESIYRDGVDGYNIELSDYFVNLKRILNFDIVEVMKFDNFILSLKS